ncbi:MULTISPECIES: histidine kinase [Microbacterium]|uniref:histidine kinase n=1 Tax=Microbacterium TaxID=33882 RepID=UPI00146F4192|nr:MULTISPECIES: histidine kinase [Microbacterium]
MRSNPVGRVASALVGVEGAGLVALAVWQVLAVVGGDTASIDSAIALIVLTAVGAAAVIAFAVAIWRGRSWGRSGAIVAQLLILAVALGAATGSYAAPSLALILAVPAIVVLVLLVLAVREAGRDSRDEASA